MRQAIPARIEPRPSARLALRLTEGQREALERLAQEHNATVSATARGALAAGLRALGAQV